MFAYMAKQTKRNFFKTREDVVSMFLGLVVVVAVVGFLVNYIEKRKGNVDIPGVSNDMRVEEEIKIGGENIGGTITVQKNDSLWKIAQRVYKDGYKWTEIAKANNLKNPGLIYVGQSLALPEIEETKTETNLGEEKIVSSEATNYVVVAGDNLWNIAVSFYNDGYKWTRIWQDNKDKLNSPDLLEIGMVLSIYGKI
jgi:nucleoid-associated protein YgaU